MAHHVIQANTIGNLTLLQAGSCEVNAVHLINETAAITYVQVFDAATTAAVTLGTTRALYVLGAAASAVNEGLVGGEVQFVNGIVVACTTTPIGSTTAAASVRVWIG